MWKSLEVKGQSGYRAGPRQTAAETSCLISINSDSEEDVGIVRKLESCYEIYKDPAFPCL